MAELVRKKTVEVRITKGGDEAIVISESAGDEIVWTAERDGVEYDIKFPNGSPFQDSNGKPRTHFKARKLNPDRSGTGLYNANGGNEYHYEIHPPQVTASLDITAQGPRAPLPAAPKDPIVIVDP